MKLDRRLEKSSIWAVASTAYETLQEAKSHAGHCDNPGRLARHTDIAIQKYVLTMLEDAIIAEKEVVQTLCKYHIIHDFFKIY